MSHDDFKQMIPVRALLALDADDDRSLTEHLSSCAECRRDLDEWQETAAGLALSANPIEPAPGVRDQILRRVRETKTDVTTANVLPFAQAKRNVWSSFGSLGAIAAAILFVGLLVYLVLLWKENQAIRTELSSLRAQVQNSQTELEEKNRMVRMLEQPGMKFMELKGMPIAPQAIAKFAYDSSGHAMIMTKGLPAAPVGKQYQLWFIVPGKAPMPGKSFSTDNEGKAVMEEQMPAEAMNSAVIAITLEKQGGVTKPEGAMYLSSRS